MVEKHIWVLGEHGAGKTSLILLFPQVVVKPGRVLQPADARTRDQIYQWQDDFFRKGEFPPGGEQQVLKDFRFSLSNRKEWEEAYKSRRPAPSRAVHIHERAMDFDRPRSDDLVDLFAEDLGLVVCVDVGSKSWQTVCESVIELRQRLPKRPGRCRFCLVITKVDLLAGRGEIADGQRLTVTADYALQRAAGQEMWEALQPVLRDLHCKVVLCTTVGVLHDERGLAKPNQADEDGRRVGDPFQIWWYGPDEVFFHVLGPIEL